MTRDPEWDEDSRNWELAYTDYLNNRCHCGAQVDEAHDPTSVWLVDHTVCQRCRALESVQRAKAEEDERSEKAGRKVFPGARKWTAVRVDPTNM